MLPKDPGPSNLIPMGEATLGDQHMRTDRMNMDSRPGLNKQLINQICLFRIDLPCYPYLWQEGLILELEALVMIDPVESSKLEFQIR